MTVKRDFSGGGRNLTAKSDCCLWGQSEGKRDVIGGRRKEVETGILVMAGGRTRQRMWCDCVRGQSLLRASGGRCRVSSVKRNAFYRLRRFL